MHTTYIIKHQTCRHYPIWNICGKKNEAALRFARFWFGSKKDCIVAWHLAMPVLCSLTIAHAAAAALRAQCRNKDDTEKMADDLEVLKEVLAQISVCETYVEHASMTKFCHRVLWSTRGLLLGWEIPSTSLQEVPVAHMPALGKKQNLEDRASKPRSLFTWSHLEPQFLADPAGPLGGRTMGVAIPFRSPIGI